MKPGASTEGVQKAFTLVELLVVVAIVAILSALLAPAMRGLIGVTGPRGGVSILGGALEQARFAAMQSGVSAYVGFPFDDNAISADERYSSCIVFREPREDETSRVVIARWLKMPRGIYMAPGTNFPTTALSVSNFPKLGMQSPKSLTVVEFDRFGRLKPSGSEVNLLVGEKAQPGGDFAGRKSTLAVQPLTGRVVVTDTDP